MRVVFSAISLVAWTLLSAQSAAARPQNELVWSDEFNGNSIDSTKWNVANDFYHCCNDELQIYEKDQISVKGGNLILRSSNRFALRFLLILDALQPFPDL